MTQAAPSCVDNSTRPQFPPIYKQNGGACGQFTAIASIFIYEMNLLNGTRADTDDTRFPADFSWNMINGANKKNGSEATGDGRLFLRFGGADKSAASSPRNPPMPKPS